ncbi:MAG: glycerol-3-phosphate 1-O-acyltransferase PlsY [Actinomycetota bacterium]|nr:glycerol-3-phosphate 1-O-acyltransferase PlsY [Actinomycetota bacterium]MDQ2981695.1 glycerol-3-phosphate 1-O-acyltransferase PlsY [Actinomycetota bacterium]
MSTALFALAGYLAGSIPTGYWLVRALRREDIRKTGSGNIGATNVWRTYGPRLGLPVMFLDTAKGFVPALLATVYVGHLAGVLAGGAAMLGHWRPLFMRFARGGKAVATCGGAFLGVAPIVGAIGAGVWILAFAVFRYPSVASMTAAVSLPLVALGLGEPWPVIAFAAIAALAVIVLHRPNISRLRAGTETRFRFRRPAQPLKS